MSDIIITPASGKIDFYQDLGAASLAKIELTSANDLSLSTTSGNLIIGDASRDIYIGNGINDVDIVFEQNGEIRPLPAKTLNIGTSGSFTQILASKVNINQNSFTSIPLDVYSSTSGATILNVAGTKGALFSVTDNLSGSLMSVNNDAGLPVFEVFSDDRVVAGRFNQNDFVMTSGGNVGIGTGVPSSKFHVLGTSTFNGDVSSTGSFIAGSGSAALPSFEFVGDADTGMFSPAANTIGLATSGVERLRINNAGNVGINTTNFNFFDIVNDNRTAAVSVSGDVLVQNALYFYNPSEVDNRRRGLISSEGDGILNTLGVGEKVDILGNSVVMNASGLVVNNGGGLGGSACQLLGDYGAIIENILIVNSNANGNATVGIGTSTPTHNLHVVGSGLVTNGLSVSESLSLNGSGVGLYDTSVLNLGTISGTNAINCGQDRQIQNLTLNGVATTFTKGSGWPTSNSVARETTLNIFASGNTSVTWTIVNDWYRQPDSPLPSGRHIVLLRSIGSGTMQGHYIGNKTN